MTNTTIPHNEFVNLNNQGKAEFMWNKDKVLIAFSNMNSEIKTNKNKLLGKITSSKIYKSYKNNMLTFWAVNLLLLLTPAKLVLIFSFVFGALMYFIEKLVLSALKMAIISDESFYNELHEQNVVMVVKG